MNTRERLESRRNDRRAWPTWLSVRARNVLHNCGLEHPSDILAYAPSDFYGVNHCGAATLVEFARLYELESAKMRIEWGRIDGD